MSIYRLFSLTVIFLVAVNAFAQAEKDHLRTLFVGNSYIFVNDVDKAYEGIVQSSQKHKNTTVVRIAPGGYRLKYHARDASEQGSPLNKALNSKQGWDFVVLQEQSQTPGLATARDQVASQDAAVQLAKSVKTSGGTVVLYMTWARRDARGTKATNKNAFKSMQDALAGGYEEIAKKVKAAGVKVKIAPVGKGFETAMNLYGVDFLRSLYVEDGSHPSESGAYMAACVIYATIHDADPSLITWKTSGLTSDQAAKIRNAAKVAINSYNKRIAA